MRALSDAEFLFFWEQGLEQLPFERALALLERACPELTSEELATLSIGRRDALLLRLRECAFGANLQALASCPRCQVAAEIDLDLRQLQIQREPASSITAPFIVGDRTLQLRAPNSADLADSLGLSPDDAARHILSRCLAADETLTLSEDLVSKAAECIAVLDPQADLQMEMVCSACGQPWLERFDIVAFFWSELDAWARRTLREIHALASAYGWSESQILGLSALRRNTYLEMACI